MYDATNSQVCTTHGTGVGQVYASKLCSVSLTEKWISLSCMQAYGSHVKAASGWVDLPQTKLGPGNSQGQMASKNFLRPPRDSLRFPSPPWSSASVMPFL